MTDDSQNQDESQKNEEANSSVTKIQAVKLAREIANEGSDWNLIQEILQEIQATYIVVDAKTMPSVPKLRDELVAEVERRFEEDLDKQKVLLEGIPATPSIRAWLKKEGWEEAVWSKLRTKELFSTEKRAEVIESLRVRAIKQSDSAAKLWLTMSGDYSDKMEVNDKTIDTFREINSIILNKKKNE